MQLISRRLKSEDFEILSLVFLQIKFKDIFFRNKKIRITKCSVAIILTKLIIGTKMSLNSEHRCYCKDLVLLIITEY